MTDTNRQLGRPKATNPMTARITILCRPEDRLVIEQRARDLDRSVGSYIRNQLGLTQKVGE